MVTDSFDMNRRLRVPGRRHPTIWAIGGGKGGVGKSLVCSSLAIVSARRGHRCALIDLDLGAANAHSLIGMRPPARSLSHFFDRRIETLAEILCPTPFENLEIVGGTRASLDLANPKYSQKERLLRQIRELDFDHVFLDLSAGCAFNVLDFLLAAQKRIAVLIPEATAIENTQHFLKTAFFRSLRTVAKQEPLRSAIQLALTTPGMRVHSARDLVRAVGQIDAQAGALLADQAAAFSPMLVINQISAHGPEDSASQIALACRHYLAASVRERGRLPRDERVREAVAKGAHVLDVFPGSRFAVAIESMLDDILSDAPSEALATVPRRSDLGAHRALLPSLDDTTDPGAYLRKCRKELGLSLIDVCRQTRIRSLASIEDGRYEALPGESYVAAFVRQYAQTLGVPDVDRLTTLYLRRYRAALAS
ncbi:MAG: helix-turn-helix domain-containing protein [Myxococcota bacterium]